MEYCFLNIVENKVLKFQSFQDKRIDICILTFTF